jgi:hypothetical protein
MEELINFQRPDPVESRVVRSRCASVSRARLSGTPQRGVVTWFVAPNTQFSLRPERLAAKVATPIRGQLNFPGARKQRVSAFVDRAAGKSPRLSDGYYC